MKLYLWGMLNGVGLCVGMASLLPTHPLPPIEAWGMIVIAGLFTAARWQRTYN